MTFAATRLGRVAQMMIEEGEARESPALQKAGEVCLRRGITGDDSDMDVLVNVTLYTYANARGICIDCLPNHAH